MKVLIRILVLSLVLVGCSKDGDEIAPKDNFSDLFGGKPFKGTAEGVRINEGDENYTWNGEGTVAVIEASGDSVSIVFMADFGEEGDINLKMRGKVEGSNFLMESEGSASFFRIVNEKITGDISNDAQEMNFEGTLREEQANMKVRVYFKETTGAFPKGSSLNLTFKTSREVSEDDDSGEGCQMRMVPIWGPNGMTMGMVPDC